ncbi:MAG: tetratricopeptide repeat protein [Nitrospira sp.]|nr:tetratricopeptide repeat protein [Nitrospira sp.]
MNENLEDLKQKADQLESDGSWDKLIPLCTKIIDLEQEPRAKASVYVKRGAAYIQKGEYEKAIEDCTKAVELNPAHANAYINRGIAYDKKGDHDLAIKDYTKVPELEPNNLFAYHNRGIAYINKNDHDKALENFNKILERDPANEEIHLFCGFAYSLKGEHDKAVEYFTKALELNLNYANAYLCRGFVYIDKANFLNAFKDFKEAVKYDPLLKGEVSEICVADQIADIYKNHAEKVGAKAFELYFWLLEAISNIQQKQLYAPQPNAEVAHYTSLHTLKSLADKGRFRLYNAAYMNDPEEGRVFFDIMKESGIDVQEVFYGDEAPPYPSPAYIGSFVKVDKKDEEKDKLFLWRMYGKRNGQEAVGACLIFKHEGTVFAKSPNSQTGAMQQLQSKLLMSESVHQNPEEKQPRKPELYKIVYSDEEIPQEFPLSPAMQLAGIPSSDKWNNQELCKKLAESLKQIKEHIENEKDNENKRELRKLVCDLLDTIRFLFKARHYQEEGEVRVVHVRYYDETKTTQKEDGIQVDTEQIPPRFYLETHDDFRFSEVILGPQTRGAPEWKRWLKEQDKTLSVKRSGIKYGKPYF